jgi:uncharacterized membrane protein required for colicin V production
MNWFDVAVIVLILASVASGLRHGLSHAGFGFLAVVTSFLTAAWLFPVTQPQFVFTFVCLMLASVACIFICSKWFKYSGTGWLDKFLGGAFGLVNSFIFWVFAVVALLVFAPKMPREYVARSAFGPYALEAASVAVEAVPEDVKLRLARNCRDLSLVLPPALRRRLPDSTTNEI